MAIKLEVMESPFFMDGPVKRFVGDIYTEENEKQAQAYIDLGWCKNVETGEQGERKPGVAKLDVNNVVSKVNG